MKPPALRIVAPDEPAETVAERVRRLQAEAREAAGAHVQAMLDALVALHAMAGEIQAGGDAYSYGTRSLAREICRDCESRGLMLKQIVGRVS